MTNQILFYLDRSGIKVNNIISVDFKANISVTASLFDSYYCVSYLLAFIDNKGFFFNSTSFARYMLL